MIRIFTLTILFVCFFLKGMSQCVGTASITVTINPATVANFSNVVSGLTANFTNSSTNALSYLWDFGDGSTSTITNPNHTYSTPGSYVVTLTSNNACGTDVTTQTIVVSCPSATVNITASGSTTICAGSTLTLTASSGFTSYQWYNASGAVSGAISSTYTTSVAGVYYVIASNASCSYTSSNTTVTVNPLPTSFFTNSVSGLTVSFTEGATNETSYNWNFGDGSTSTLANPSHTYTSVGTYTVMLTVTNSCGTQVYNQTINLSCPTATVNVTSSATSFCAGSSATLTASSGFGGYQWYNASGAISGATASTYTANSAGTYYVIANNASCTYTSTSTAITVNPLPTSGFSNSISGLSATFTETAANETTYSWDFGDGATSTTPNPSHTYATVGTYTVTLTVTNACGTDVYTQVVNLACPTAVVNITAMSSTTFCAGGSVVLNATFGFGSYQWYDASGTITGATSASYTATNAGVYYVIANNATCAYTSSNTTVNINPLPTANYTVTSSGLTVNFTESASNEISYLWDFGDGITSTLPNPNHSYATGGAYAVTLTASNACGSDVYTMNVNVNCTPTVVIISPLGSTNICSGSSVNLSVTTGYISYQWSLNGTIISGATSNTYAANSPGDYSVTVTDAGSCLYNSTTIAVTSIPNPTSSFSFSSSGFNVSFNETASDELTYTWDFGDGSNSTSANPTHTYAALGTYTVVLTVNNGCGSDTYTQIININCMPSTVNVTNSGATTFCAGSSVVLTTSGYSSYQWYNGATPIAGATSSSYTATTAGNYSVTAVSAAGCSYTSSSTAVSVNPLPISDFTSSLSGFVLGVTENATNETSYSWNFGDGATSSLANPTHVYSTPGTYIITLTVNNACGSDVYSQTINISCPLLSLSTSAISSTTICAGSNVSLSASAGFLTYQWYQDGVAIAGATSNTYLATNAGVYTVSAENADGCTYNGSNNQTVIVNPLPIADFTNVVTGLGVNFTESASNETTYNWDFGDGNTSTLASPNHSYSSAGVYTVTLTVSNSCGSDIFTQNITVSCAAMSINISSLAMSFCTGNSVTIAATSGFASYSWELNGSPIVGINDNITVSTPGVYAVNVSDGLGCFASSNNLTISENPLPIFSLGNDTAVCSSISLVGPTSTTYLWSNGATSNSINVTSDGLYSLTITDGNGCSFTDDIDVRITNPADCITADFGYTISQVPSTDVVFNFKSNRTDGYFQSIEVYDVSGKILISYLFEDGTYEFALPIDALDAAMYIARFTYNGNTYTEKLMKVK